MSEQQDVVISTGLTTIAEVDPDIQAASRVIVFTDEGPTELVGAIPHMVGAVVFNVETAKAVDMYAIQMPDSAESAGPGRVRVQNPFTMQVLPSGALIIGRADDGTALRIYAPGSWQELAVVVPDWSGPIYDGTADGVSPSA